MRKWLFLFVSVISVFRSVQAHEQDLLKAADVSQIMSQILNQHLGNKDMTGKILQNALVVYIEQFDPNRMYLLVEEVAPFLNLPPQELDHFLEQYKKSNFTIFQNLNAVIQKAIVRSRKLREDIEKTDVDKLFNTSTVARTFETYPVNEKQLKDHIIENLETFIHAQKQRYGQPSTKQRRDFLLSAYEEHLRENENQYLYQDDKGQKLPSAEQANLFTIHILKALASSLDSHTSFYQNNEAYDMRLRLQKEFQGIGVIFKETPEGVAVSGMVEEGPAAKSGLIKTGDLLLSVNGKSVVGMPYDKILELLHDETNPSLTLEFKRPAPSSDKEKPYSVELKRQTIVLNNDRVDTKAVQFGNGIIGVITLHSFYQGEDVSSEKDVRGAIEKLEKQGNLKGLILDLRDNRGGFLSQAIKVAGLFVTNGVIVISKYADGEKHIYRDVDSKIAYDGPLIVLTSKITASAAEIVAQALQDYGVALVVGDEHTYGKGTIQTQTVTDNRSASYFKVTVGKYYTVSGKTPQKEGVIADVVVPGHWNKEEVGEKYANTVDGDMIDPEFNDDLSDVNPSLKPWFMKYYTPQLQHKTTIWRNLLPKLRENSKYRIANNKSYQYYIQGDVGGSTDEDSQDEEWGGGDRNAKNAGEDDLQLNEAINVVKDMYVLHASGKGQ